MRTTIRGQEIECSVAEFKELTDNIVDETYDEDNDYGDTMASDNDMDDDNPETSLPKISLLPKTTHRQVISSYQHWMKKDLRILKKNSHLPMKKLMQMFSGRSEDSLKTQLFLIRHNNRDMKRLFKRDMKRLLKPKNKNIPRFKYMNLRAQTLMKDDGISRNDALKRASIEWNLVEKARQ